MSGRNRFGHDDGMHAWPSVLPVIMTKRFLPTHRTGRARVGRMGFGLRRQVSRKANILLLVGGVSLNHWEDHKAQPHDHWWANFVHATRRSLGPNSNASSTETEPDDNVARGLH